MTESARIAPDLVGRETELAAIDSALDRLGDGVGGLLAVEGEPGIGKSRLLVELAERAEERGHLVLAGAAAEFERDLPFSVLLDALDAYLGSLDHSRLSVRGIGHLPELAAIFPSLAEAGDGSEAAGGGGERYRTHRAIGGLLSALGDGRGLVLVLDDLHWADSASLELLQGICRRPPEGRVLIAVAYRPQGTVASLEGGLRIAESAGRAAVVSPERLEEGDAGSLVPAELTGASRRALLAAAGGNPFYIEQLLRSPDSVGRAGGAAEETLEGGFRLPAAIAASLAEELQALEPDARRLLEGASVVGEPFRLRLAAEVAGIDPDRALDLTDVATEAAVIRPGRTPGHFNFRHPLLRRAVYAGAGEGWKVEAHRRAAEALAAQGAEPAARAHHVAVSAEPGDTEAVALLREAAGRAGGRAPVSAATWLERALELLPEGSDPVRMEILAELGRAYLTAGILDRAAESTRAAIELAGDGVDPHLIVELAEIDQWRGEVLEGIEALEQLAADPETPPEIRALAELRLVYLCRYTAQFEKAFGHAQRALETAEEHSVAPVVAGARAAFAEVAANFDRAAATAQHEEASKLLASLPLAEQERSLDAYFSLGWSAAHLGRLTEAVENFDRGLELAQRTGSVRHLLTLRTDACDALLRAGRAREAIERAADGVEVGRLQSSPGYLWYPLWIQSQVLLRTGDLKGARAAFDEGWATGTLGKQPMYEAMMGAQRAALLRAAGDEVAARDALYAGFGTEDLSMIPIGQRSTLWELLLDAALAEGGDGADAIVADAVEQARASGLESAIAAALRLRAKLERASGSFADAAEAAREAASIADEADLPVEAERARIELGLALAAAGERSEGADELARAEASLGAMGMEGLRAEAARELRRLGRRTGPRRSDGDGASVEGELSDLSARELEIAELVAEQLTNREIAERLFLSEKTVESHLRNTFAKLGVSSRIAVAQAIERRRLAG